MRWEVTGGNNFNLTLISHMLTLLRVLHFKASEEHMKPKKLTERAYN